MAIRGEERKVRAERYVDKHVDKAHALEDLFGVDGAVKFLDTRIRSAVDSWPVARRMLSMRHVVVMPGRTGQGRHTLMRAYCRARGYSLMHVTPADAYNGMMFAIAHEAKARQPCVVFFDRCDIFFQEQHPCVRFGNEWWSALELMFSPRHSATAESDRRVWFVMSLTNEVDVQALMEAAREADKPGADAEAARVAHASRYAPWMYELISPDIDSCPLMPMDERELAVVVRRHIEAVFGENDDNDDSAAAGLIAAAAIDHSKRTGAFGGFPGDAVRMLETHVTSSAYARPDEEGVKAWLTENRLTPGMRREEEEEESGKKRKRTKEPPTARPPRKVEFVEDPDAFAWGQ